MRLILPAALIALAPISAARADQAAAVAAFSGGFASYCSAAFLEDGGLIEPPVRHDMVSPVTWGGDPVPVTLWEFRCNIGAYNVQTVFLKDSESEGLVPLSFARPDLDVVLEDPENYEGPVKEVRIAGYSANPYVVNATVDAAAGTISEYSAWRGIGDASSAAVWTLVDEGFRLTRFDVDPTYDGEVTPKTLVSFP